jgi:uncharacterized membrane protein SpoIIM required for sporulation
MRPGVLALLALLLASGCSLAQSLQMSNATPRQRETVYAVMGTFAVMAIVAGVIAGAPAEPPAMPRPADEPPLAW